MVASKSFAGIAPGPREESLDNSTPWFNSKADLIGALAYDLYRNQRGLGDFLPGISASEKTRWTNGKKCCAAMDLVWPRR